MVSTFTTNLNLEKQTAGENTDTWGSKLNDVLDQLDDAIAGRLSKSVAGSSNITLTTAEARNAWHEYNGTLTGNISVIVPTKEKIYFIFNNTAGSFTLTVKTSAGTGIVVTQGEKAILYADGTDVIEATDFYVDPLTTRGDLVARGASATTRLAIGAANTVLGSDGTDPSWGTVATAMIANNAVNGEKIAMGSDAQGDVLFYNGTDYARLAPGTSGKFLKTLGAGNNPVWDAPTFSQANQAAIEAETNEYTYVPPDLVKHSPGVAKVWCTVDRSAGTPTLESPDHGVSSVADVSSAVTKISFTTNFSTAVFTPVASVLDGGANFAKSITRLVGSVNVTVYNDAGALSDTVDFALSCFGDQ